MVGAITWYDWFKAAHVLASVVWVGGGTILAVLALRTRRAGDPLQMVHIAKQAEWVGTRIFTPLSLLLLAFGFGMMENGASPWSYGDFWVDFGLGVWGASFLIGAGFLGPESGRLAKVLASRGAEDPEVRRRIDRILLVVRLDEALLLLAVFDMTAKPFL